MNKLQDIIALVIVPALCAFVLYVFSVRCGMLPEPQWFKQIKGPSYPEKP